MDIRAIETINSSFPFSYCLLIHHCITSESICMLNLIHHISQSLCWKLLNMPWLCLTLLFVNLVPVQLYKTNQCSRLQKSTRKAVPTFWVYCWKVLKRINVLHLSIISNPNMSMCYICNPVLCCLFTRSKVSKNTHVLKEFLHPRLFTAFFIWNFHAFSSTSFTSICSRKLFLKAHETQETML